jgi:hypothetical protein
MDVAKREAQRVAAEMGAEGDPKLQMFNQGGETVPLLSIPDQASASGLVPASSLVRR